MTEPICTAVLRAETGPCEHRLHFAIGSNDGLCPFTPADFTHSQTAQGMSIWPMAHPYLGPRLGICGHAESEHFEDDEGQGWCNGCYDDLLLDQGEEVEHIFTTEEPANAPTGAAKE